MPWVVPVDPAAPVTDTASVPDLTETPIAVSPPDLISDLPPFEQDSIDIQTVLRVIGNELARLEAARQELIANFFPATADTLLHFYEAMLGLPTDVPGAELLARQTTVLAYMRSLSANASASDWSARLTDLIGNAWTVSTYDPALGGSSPVPPYTLLIRFPFAPLQTAPTGLAVTQSGSGGSLSGARYWAVTALTAYGESTVSAQVNLTMTAGEVAHLTWAAQPSPVTGYRVYRGSSPTGLGLVAQVSTNSFDDTGATAPGATPPSENTTASTAASTALNLARAITPAHLQIQAGYTAGFVIGVSEIGVDAL